jgi:M6 family metalloprotease-like protein
MRKKFTFIFFGLLFVWIGQEAFAVPAVPWPVEKVQPDGKKITVYLRGDEKVHWMESLDGYTLMYDSQKYVVYAEQDRQGNLIPSKVKPGEKLPSNIKKGLRYSPSQVDMLSQIRKVTEDGIAQKAFIGQKKALCVLVGFSNRTFQKTIPEFEALMNQVGYSAGGAKGSVKDFYLENSYGQLELTVTVVGTYTAPNTTAYYATRQREFAQFAIDAANPDVDYNEFAVDGKLETFHIIFAGYGDEAIDNGQQIWSHKWQLAAPVTRDGVRISVYSCSPELRGGSGSNITYIGVIAHELGHVFGSPDYYDTSGGSFAGTGNWDLMAGGSWNDNGRQPAHVNILQKILYGWVTPVDLTDETQVTDMQASALSPEAYTFQVNANGEEYILENKQPEGFDASLPGHGLLIWHVHSSARGGNGSNAAHPQQLYPVCAASSTAIPSGTSSSYGAINSAGTPYPGTSGKNTFTDSSIPQAFTWSGLTGIGKPITTIVESVDGKISFGFMTGIVKDPVTNLQASVDGGKVSLSWTAPANDVVLGYNIYRDNILQYAISNKTVTNYTALNVPNGSYTYSVTAKYDLVESEKESVQVTVTGGADAFCLPVTNLNASAGLDKVNLSWTAPFTGGWIGIAGEPTTAYGFGFEWDSFAGTLYTPEDLAGLEGYKISKIKFAPNESGATYAVAIYKVPASGDPVLIYEQPINAGSLTYGLVYNEIALTTPVEYNATEGLIIGIQTHSLGGYFMSVDNGNSNPGRNVFYDEDGWCLLEDIGIPSGRNFCLQAYLDGSSGAPAILMPQKTPASNTSFLKKGTKSKQLRASGINLRTDNANKAPATIAKYKIYRDGQLIDETTSTSYTDNTGVNPATTYSYCVSVVYSNDCNSETACVEATTQTPVNQNNPVQNLQADINDLTVNLTWEAPFAGGAIGYSSDVINNAYAGSTDFSIAARFTPNDLKKMSGMQLTQVQFATYPTTDANVNPSTVAYTIRIWTGGGSSGPEQLVYEQPVPTFGLSWNTVTLSAPIDINIYEDLWIGVRAQKLVSGNIYPATCDAGPAVVGKGDMIYINNVWQSWTEYTSSSTSPANVNWTLKGMVQYPDGSAPAVLSSIPYATSETYPVSTDKVSEEGLQSVPTATPSTSVGPQRAAPEPTGYKIERDGTEITTVGPDVFAYSDVTNLPVNTYNYCVIAVYGSEESDPECVSATTETPYKPIAGLEVKVVLDEVSITWTPPASTGVGDAQYDVYADGVLIADDIDETHLELTGVAAGSYTYCVKAVYESGTVETDPLCRTVSVVDLGDPHRPVSNLTASSVSLTGTLTWEAPKYVQKLRYHTFESGAFSGIGINSAADFDIAARWTPDDLASVGGLLLTKVRFIPRLAKEITSYSVRVWVDGDGESRNAGNLVVDQEILTHTVNQWNEIYLNTPVPIDPTKELWIGIRCNTSGDYPAPMQMNNAVELKGNLMYFQGAWYAATELGATLNGNWIIDGIAAYHQGLDAAPILLSTLQDAENRAVNGALSVSPQAGTVAPAIEQVPALPTVSKYEVSRDGVALNETTETTYTDQVTASGTYTYSVKAIYDDGVDSGTESVELTYEECDTPPSDLLATITGNTVTLEWSYVRDDVTFNVYRDNVLIADGITDKHWEDILTEGDYNTYTYCVKAAFTGCETDAVCTEVIYEPACNPVIDLTAERIENEVTLTWKSGQTASNVLFSEGFEAGIPSTWTQIDADGDGNLWYGLNTNQNPQLIPHSGIGFVTSASYSSAPLTPDNWLITPAVTLTSGEHLSYYIGAQDAAWAAEHYGVYISTTTKDISAFTLLHEETMTPAPGQQIIANPAPGMFRTEGPQKAQGTWYERTIDLSAYAGQTVYIAFRHFNTTDEFRLNLDDVTISKSSDSKYNVYLDGTLVAGDIEETTFVHQLPEYAYGTYEYCITNVSTVENCESDSRCVEVEYALSCRKVVNLNANVANGIVTLQWEVDETGFPATPPAYTFNVYCNDVLLADGLTATTYSAPLSAYGEYTYCVTMLLSSSNCESDPACSHVTHEPDCMPVINLTANLTGNQVQLNWQNGKTPKAIFKESFENGIPSDWKNVDADGDGYNWRIATSESDGVSPHTGSAVATSDSYNGLALAPDNWLITPSIKLTDNNTLTYWFSAQNDTYADEHYGVYISTTDTELNSFTLLHDETISGSPANFSKVHQAPTVKSAIDEPQKAQGKWYQRGIDLSAYAGQTVYLAFRHYDCYDQWALNIDDIAVVEPPKTNLYNVYQNNELIADGIATTTFETTLSETGDYRYCVVATSGDCTSTETCIDVHFVYECVAPTNLTAELSGNTASLNWEFTPAVEKVNNLLYEDFEGTVDNWMVIDNDGDGLTWGLASGNSPHSGNRYASSESFYFIFPLTPDNWLFSPEVQLTEANQLKYYVRTFETEYPAENYGVYISTQFDPNAFDPNDFTLLFEETMQSAPGQNVPNVADPKQFRSEGPDYVLGTWHERTIDLSAYAGQRVTIAFRHHNCTDQWSLNLDDVAITEPVAPVFNVYENNVLIAEKITETHYEATLTAGNDSEFCITYVGDYCESDAVCVPVYFVNADGNTEFCEGGSVTLSVPEESNYTYQWYKDGSLIAAATESSYEATESGDYFVEVTTPNSKFTSDEIEVLVLQATYLFSLPTGALTFDVDGSVNKIVTITVNDPEDYITRLGLSFYVNAPNWISYTLVGNVLTLTAEPNTTGVARTGSIRIWLGENGSVFNASNGYEIAVNQKALFNIDMLNYSLAAVLYNGMPQAVNVSVKSGYSGYGTITVKYNRSTEVPINAGAYTVSIDLSGGSNFGPVSEMILGNLMIYRAAVTIQPNNASRPYGTENPNFTLNITGLEGRDTPASLGTITITTTATTASLPGNYSITARGAQNMNYNIDYRSGTLTVTKLSQTISFPEITSKRIGDSFQAGATSSGGLLISYSSSDPSIAEVTGNGTVTAKAVGTVSITASQEGNAIYESAASVTRQFVVEDGTAIDNVVAGNSITVYPNPASKSTPVYVSADVEEALLNDAVIAVYNASGSMLKLVEVTGKRTEVKLPSASGTYILQLKGKTGVLKNLKVVVK